MALRRVKYQDIDKQKWDQLQSGAHQNNMFCKSWYLDICAEEWDALIWGEYEAGFPLPTSTKAGVTFLYLPFFVRQLNILGQSDADKWDELLFFLKREFKRVDISISGEAKNNLPTLAHQQLDLTSGYDTIKSSYSNNAKRLIKKCAAQEIKVNDEASPAELIEYFKRETGKKIKKLQEEQYVILQRLMEHCLSKKIGRCVSVELEGELLGSAFFMEHEDRVTFLKSYSSEKGKKLGASYYLMDHAIQHYAANFSTFDFGGSKVESVAQFYKKFGAIDAFYLHLSFDNSPAYHKLIREVKRKIKG